MSSTEKSSSGILIKAPVSGQIVALDQVPDPVFSEKALGDGVAVIPEDGRIVSPVNGEIATVAATKHAFGFASEDGLDVLVHVGLETVALDGEGFTVHVKEGDKVKAGDLIAEVDLKFLAGKEINPITPILICGGAEEMEMQTASGHVSAGSNAVITLTAKEAAPERKPEPAQEEPKKKGFSINFDLLQKLGKVLMTVIAVMPAAGLMLSVGKLVQMAGADIPMILTIGSTMENIGWAIINNLHILFAAAIGGSWAKERAGGAFAAIISFILINCITGAAFGVTSAMLNEEGAVVMSLFGQEMLVENYFTSVLGAPALNMVYLWELSLDLWAEWCIINITISVSFRMHCRSLTESVLCPWR